jgi:hypothetical protein
MMLYNKIQKLMLAFCKRIINIQDFPVQWKKWVPVQAPTVYVSTLCLNFPKLIVNI